MAVNTLIQGTLISTLTKNFHVFGDQDEKDFLERITANVFTVKVASKLSVKAEYVFTR